MGFSGLDQDCFQMFEDFLDGHRVHLAAGVVAFFDQALEIVACDLGGEIVGDDFASALLLLDPGEAGHGDPHRFAVHVESHIDGIGMARGDGYDVGFPAAMKIFAGPAVGYVEVFVHDSSVSPERGWGQAAAL